MTAPRGYEPYEPGAAVREHRRNGPGSQRLPTETGPRALEVPRDCEGRVEPPRVKQRQRRLSGREDSVRSRSARGLSPREIQGHREARYGPEVAPTLISPVTQAVLEEITAGQHRYLDALLVKSREDGTVRNRAVYRVLGGTRSGHQELWGLWIAPTEGAKFWLAGLTELKNRGMQDLLYCRCRGAHRLSRGPCDRVS